MQNTGREIENSGWLASIWRDLSSTQRLAQEFVSGPSPAAKTRLLCFNKTQSRAVTGLLTGLNNLRRHLYIMGLIDSRCRTEEETSAHTLCACEAFASLRHVYLGSFFSDPEDIKSCLGAVWNFSKRTGLHELVSDFGAQRACFKA
jgi:hypothetical protein